MEWHIFSPTPQCSSVYVGGVYVILILRAWQTSHMGQQSLTKLNAKQATYMSESFLSLNIMYGSGRNSSFVIQELIMQHFYVFQKIRSSICHHEFQVQSKSLYQNNLIQNSGEFKAKNQVLEKNYNRTTIHHFYLRDYSESSLFYSALKNKLKQTRHTFLFCF